LLYPERKREKGTRERKLPEKKGMILQDLLKHRQERKREFPFLDLIIGLDNRFHNRVRIATAKEIQSQPQGMEGRKPSSRIRGSFKEMIRIKEFPGREKELDGTRKMRGNLNPRINRGSPIGKDEESLAKALKRPGVEKLLHELQKNENLGGRSPFAGNQEGDLAGIET
jgi:hypothetical protein